MADFYENQQQARRKTGLLAFYFLVAVLLIVLAVDLVLFFSDGYFRSGMIAPAAAQMADFPRWLASERGIVASIATLLVIAAGSLFKTLRLGKGGDQVAIMAGGTWVAQDTQHPAERQLLNVVEEMAIASGIQPPRVYLMRDEPGINAFVAGLTPNNTALAITRGALEQLSRDELQGVIGHEFSHILNSDMRINVRMIGLLAGILLIGRIGRILMDTRQARSSGSSRGKGGNPLPLIGLALYAIGGIGLVAGQLIQAAMSRQREFLADASSVQFTRNPLGIGGALVKIRNAQEQSFLRSTHATDISHMCFGEVMQRRFNGLFATHPPLDERIRAVAPSLARKGRRAQGAGDAAPGAVGAAGGTSELSAGLTGSGMSSAGATGADLARHLKGSVGTLGGPQVVHGRQLHQALPPALLDMAHTPHDATTLLYALVLLAPQKDAVVNQNLKALFEPGQLKALVTLRTELKTLPVALWLPLLDITLSTLASQAPTQRKAVLERLQRLIDADGHYTLRECVFFLMAEKTLEKPASRPHRHNTLATVSEEIAAFFVALTHSSDEDASQQASRYQWAMKCLGLTASTPPVQPDARHLSQALHTLAQLSPLLKRSLVDCAVDVVAADRRVTLAEVEMLRGFCTLMDCPMPPVAL